MVTDFSAKHKASGIKFCTAVHRRPKQGIAHIGGTLLPRSPKSELYYTELYIQMVDAYPSLQASAD